jgi:TolB-like protein/DNA-binding winged helix-turn-helix (wHTH) protein
MKFRIGSFLFDAATREIRSGGAAVPVEPQVFDLLQLLIENRTRVVGKDELVDRIWGGRAISDAALSTCVKAARRALGDDGQRQAVIRTVHRRGFRFVAIVAPAEGAAVGMPGPPAADPAPVEPGAEAYDLDLTLPQRPSIAVMPFRAAGGSERELVMADGLSRDINVRLARTRWLFVTARASAARFAAPEVDPVQIGRLLGVRYLLDGALVADDDRLRLTVTLADVVRGCEIWAERFDRRLEDVFAVQEEIGDTVVAAVESEIELKERQRAMLRPLASLDAWSAYHRASNHLFRFRAEDYDQAEVYLKLAARLDPSSPRVFAGLSFLHWQRAFLELTGDRPGEIARSFDFAHQSVALDPLDPLGHWVLGRAHLLQGEFEQAVGELGAAVELNPNFAIGQYSMAFGLMFDGRSATGFEHLDRARRLSPYDPMTFAFLAQRGAACGLTGDAEKAAEFSRRAVRQPNAHHHVLAIAAWCHGVADRRAEARQLVTELRALRPGYTRDDYFRAFPFRAQQRSIIERAMAKVGL